MTHSLRIAHKEHQVLFDLLLLTLIYTLAHGLMLINQGVFWDDWVIYNFDRALLSERFRQTGIGWIGYLHLLVSWGGVSAYRAVAFASYLLAAWCVYCTLVEMKIDRYSCFFVALIFATFPVNNARIAMIILPYSICYALFFLGFWLTAIFLKTRNRWYRAAALALLFASFSTNSLLVFYLIVILYIMYRQRPEPMSIAGWLRLVPRYADYLLLPILFWIVKNRYMKPYGFYADYNKVESEGIRDAFIETFRVFDSSFLRVIDRSSGTELFSPLFHTMSSGNLMIPFAVAALVVVVLFIGKLVMEKIDAESWKTLRLFIFGVFFFWLAAYPYLVVKHVPQMDDWDSRNQLLLPLGSALLLVYGVKLVTHHKAVTLPLYFLLVSMFVHTSILDHLSFQRDWYKQLSLMENLKTFPLMYKRTSFVFQDDTSNMNANGRAYRFYEYAAQMKLVFGDERRFGSDRKDFKGLQKWANLLNCYYNLKDFVPKEPDTLIVISHGGGDLSTAEVLKLMWWERCDKRKFDQKISDIVHLEGSNL
jgi:hypothetical protein